MELLSPAGNFEKMKFAFHYGADAVYGALQSFSLRKGAKNFTPEELNLALEYAHQRKKKFYLTLNSYFRQNDLTELEDLILVLKDLSVDAFIVSDPGVMVRLKEVFPETELHVSTQANVTNRLTAEFFQKIGANRVIVARELTLEEISEIASVPNLEVETFIHGAMCIGYSGRCLLSNALTHSAWASQPGRKDFSIRSSNSGDCAQPCRWNFQLVEKRRPGEYLPILEEGGETIILSSKDLNLSNHMKQLMDAGISSFKIEGRMKSSYYVANTARVYRYLMDHDGIAPEWLFEELYKISHRDYTTGFFFDENRSGHTTSGGYTRTHSYLAHCLEGGKGRGYFETKNKITTETALEKIGARSGNSVLRSFRFIVDGESTDVVQPNSSFWMEADCDFEEMDILRSIS